MPGRSITLMGRPLYVVSPGLPRSTVTPGQLGTFSLAPVKALNSVVFRRWDCPSHPIGPLVDAVANLARAGSAVAPHR